MTYVCLQEPICLRQIVIFLVVSIIRSVYKDCIERIEFGEISKLGKEAEQADKLEIGMGSIPVVDLRCVLA